MSKVFTVNDPPNVSKRAGKQIAVPVAHFCFKKKKASAVPLEGRRRRQSEANERAMNSPDTAN